MDNGRDRGNGLSHRLRRFPEFLKFGKRRFRTEGRVLSAAILVGIVAGIGGVVFTFAGQVVVHYALEGVVGYQATGPAGGRRLPSGLLATRDWTRPAGSRGAGCPG